MKVLRSKEFELWLESQSAKVHALVEARLFMIEQHSHFGDARYLSAGLAELRWKSGLRVYFARSGQFEVFIILGGRKMTKKRTSRKQDFCCRDMPLTKIKASKRAKLGKSKSQIGDIELLFQSLWQSLVENDIDSFKEILQVHLEAVNKEDLVRRTKISRRTLYRMLSSEGNPTLENVGKILQALAFKTYCVK